MTIGTAAAGHLTQPDNGDDEREAAGDWAGIFANPYSRESALTKPSLPTVVAKSNDRRYECRIQRDRDCCRPKARIANTKFEGNGERRWLAVRSDSVSDADRTKHRDHSRGGCTARSLSATRSLITVGSNVCGDQHQRRIHLWIVHKKTIGRQTGDLGDFRNAIRGTSVRWCMATDWKLAASPGCGFVRRCSTPSVVLDDTQTSCTWLSMGSIIGSRLAHLRWICDCKVGWTKAWWSNSTRRQCLGRRRSSA